MFSTKPAKPAGATQDDVDVPPEDFQRMKDSL
jgi:hypothetical protein